MKRLYLVGEVLLFDPAGRLANVKIVAALRIDDLILVKGERTNFQQAVRIMYKGRNPIQKAKMGEIIWLGVIKRVYQGDKVFGVIPYPPVPNGPGQPLPNPFIPPPVDPGEPTPSPKKPPPVNPMPPPKKPPIPPVDNDEPDLPDLDPLIDYLRDWKKKDKKGGGTNG